MGAMESIESGSTEEEFIQNIINSGYVVSKDCQKVFRIVKRSMFLPTKDEMNDCLQETNDDNDSQIHMPFDEETVAEMHLDNCRRDSPVRIYDAKRNVLVHQSAPSMYATVLEAMELLSNPLTPSNISFLNIGSGSGWMSTMVGCLLDAKNGAINHGIEINPRAVRISRAHIESFMNHYNLNIDNRNDSSNNNNNNSNNNNNNFKLEQFCKPEIFNYDVFRIDPFQSRRYDRIYCGAGWPSEYGDVFLRYFLNVGGILIVPYHDRNFYKITRVDEDKFVSTTLVKGIAFMELVMPPKKWVLGMEIDRHLRFPSVLGGCRSLRDSCRISFRKNLPKNSITGSSNNNNSNPFAYLTKEAIQQLIEEKGMSGEDCEYLNYFDDESTEVVGTIQSAPAPTDIFPIPEVKQLEGRRRIIRLGQPGFEAIIAM